MDGRIAFTSEQNAGTTFCVDLPAWTGEVASPKDIRFSNVVDISRTGEGDTLLYVEDNPANMNRFEVLKILKAAPSTRDIPETAAERGSNATRHGRGVHELPCQFRQPARVSRRGRQPPDRANA